VSHISIIGNLTRDVRLDYTPSGLAKAEFGVAESFKTKDREEETSYFDVVCFGDMAESAAQCLNKGTRVVVIGKMKQRRWETPEGDKRSKWDLSADAIGPDIRWATVTVQRNERTTSTASRPAAPAASGGYDDSSEQF
jgi:single-strand DNA-binding protein